jgi:hypothetical protein
MIKKKLAFTYEEVCNEKSVPTGVSIHKAPRGCGVVLLIATGLTIVGIKYPHLGCYFSISEGNPSRRKEARTNENEPNPILHF